MPNQVVYVLMSLEGSGKNKAWRPIAVVSNPDLAAQWMEVGKDVDWVPLELDDVKNISPGNKPTFQPRETTSGEEKAIELSKRMEATIQRMQKMIDDQAALIKKLTGGKKVGAVVEDSLGAVKIPPKPVEKVEGGSQPFPETLDAQGIADFIETYAAYPVDNEFVYEKFRSSHAKLMLKSIAELQEGGLDKNLQSKPKEDRYLKQSLKTQPPAVVENGVVWDGNHRLRANKRRGLTHMWCYVVMDGEASEV